MRKPPGDFAAELTGDDLASVTQWWNGLSSTNRDRVQRLIAIPECSLEFSARDDAESSDVIDMFADDWTANWEDNWETDWREYLTEHPEICLVTLEFLCCRVVYGGSQLGAELHLAFRARKTFWGFGPASDEPDPKLMFKASHFGAGAVSYGQNELVVCLATFASFGAASTTTFRQPQQVGFLTLARKRSSPIHVDGIDYRWSVSARALSSPAFVLLIVQSVNNGQRIVVTVPHQDPWLNFQGPPPPDFHYDAITPSLVRKIMAAAVNAGWVPDCPGPELSFDLQPDETVRLR